MVLTLIQPVHLSKHDFKAIKVSLNNKPLFFYFFIWFFSFFRKLVTQCKSVAMSHFFFEHITGSSQLKLLYLLVAAIMNELYTVKLITSLMHTRQAN